MDANYADIEETLGKILFHTFNVQLCHFSTCLSFYLASEADTVSTHFLPEYGFYEFIHIGRVFQGPRAQIGANFITDCIVVGS